VNRGISFFFQGKMILPALFGGDSILRRPISNSSTSWNLTRTRREKKGEANAGQELKTEPVPHFHGRLANFAKFEPAKPYQTGKLANYGELGQLFCESKLPGEMKRKISGHRFIAIWLPNLVPASSVLKKWDRHLATLLNQDEIWLMAEPVPVFQHAAG
jgi:hypothetical protein